MTKSLIAEDSLGDVEEFAGKSIRQAVELASRHGYSNPIFTNICGGLCILRFRRHAAPAADVAAK